MFGVYVKFRGCNLVGIVVDPFFVPNIEEAQNHGNLGVPRNATHPKGLTKGLLTTIIWRGGALGDFHDKKLKIEEK